MSKKMYLVIFVAILVFGSLACSGITNTMAPTPTAATTIIPSGTPYYFFEPMSGILVEQVSADIVRLYPASTCDQPTYVDAGLKAHLIVKGEEVDSDIVALICSTATLNKPTKMTPYEGREYVLWTYSDSFVPDEIDGICENDTVMVNAKETSAIKCVFSPAPNGWYQIVYPVFGGNSGHLVQNKGLSRLEVYFVGTYLMAFSQSSISAQFEGRDVWHNYDLVSSETDVKGRLILKYGLVETKPKINN